MQSFRNSVSIIGLGIVFGCSSTQPGRFSDSPDHERKVCTPEVPEKRQTHLPRLDTLSPLEGSSEGGSLLKVTGQGFKPGVQVFLGSALCEGLSFLKPSELTCSTSSQPAGEVDVIVVNPDQGCDLIKRGFHFTQVVGILPKKVRLAVGDEFQFHSQNATAPLEFKIIEGSGKIDSKTGVFTAMAPEGNVLVQLMDGKGTKDTATIQVRPVLGISVSANQLSVGGSAFVSASGGVSPYEFTIDPQDGMIDSTGRLTVVRASNDIAVKVTDVLNHSAVSHIKGVDGVRLSGPQKLEVKRQVALPVQGGFPPYSFEIVSGGGKVDPATGQFTAADQPGSVVVSVKDSAGSAHQISIVVIPELTLTPSQAVLASGSKLQLTAMGGFMPYSFRISNGAGQVNPNSGEYTAPDVTTLDSVEVKDANGSVFVSRIEVKSLMQPRVLSASLTHTCAVTHGAAKCWGENLYGQLGDGSESRRLQPQAVLGLEENVFSVATGYRHSCALMTGGSVMCWGDNSKGQLGIQSAADQSIAKSNRPRTVAGLNRGVVAIAAGQYHTCAVRDAKVFCWGDNSKGQLGVSFAKMSSIPVQVDGILDGAQAITAGTFHSCAVVSGAAQCWGWNYNGQLGNGSRVDSHLPVAVETLNQGVRNLASRGNHTCAQTDRGLYCWGYNASGQLGNWSTQSESVPVLVKGLAGMVEEVSPGFQHTCVRTSLEPWVQCWGLNYYGQIGKKGALLEKLPQPVKLSGTATALSSGVDHTCALLGESFSCWGRNSTGQLGDRTTQDRADSDVKRKLD